jgi:hypothetical protein
MPLGNVPMRTAGSIGSAAERANESVEAAGLVFACAPTAPAVVTARSAAIEKLLKKFKMAPLKALQTVHCRC